MLWLPGLLLLAAAQAESLDLTVRLGMGPGLEQLPCEVQLRVLGEDYELVPEEVRPGLRAATVQVQPAVYAYTTVRCDGPNGVLAGARYLHDVRDYTLDFHVGGSLERELKISPPALGTQAGIRPGYGYFWTLGATLWGLLALAGGAVLAYRGRGGGTV